jgi:hypothetical protein
VLGVGLVRDPRVLEEAEPGLLVRPDRARVPDRRPDDTVVDVVRREHDVAQERADELRSTALADLGRLANEQVDARSRRVEGEGLTVLVVVVDPVALDEADRSGAMADEEELGRITVAADPRAVLLELVVRIRVTRRVGPPAADVRLEEPAPDQRKIRLGQGREVVLRRGRIR